MKQLDAKQARLLRLRKKQSRKRPSFRRVESWRYARVKDSWRRARGIDSKTRRKMKMGVKSPHDGYRGPKDIRGLHPSGYVEAMVNNAQDISKYDPEIHAIRLNRRLGARKRIKILEKLQEMGFKVLNPGMTEQEMEEIREILDGEIEGLDEEFEEDSTD